jgi:hypothetical protein
MKTATEALNQLFAAINRNDMTAITKNFDPEIVRIEPKGFPTAGAYRGVAEVHAHVTKGRGTWAEWTCEPEKFLVNERRPSSGAASSIEGISVRITRGAGTLPQSSTLESRKTQIPAIARADC